MNKNKSLKELGEEYTDYIKLNNENIDICKEKIREADGDELLLSELKQTLRVLYEIGREIKANSEHLMNYYGDNFPNDIIC